MQKASRQIWRKTFKPNSLKPVEYPYGRPKLCEIENCDPLMVFEKVCNLDQLIELLIFQSELYMEQSGKPFSTNSDEIKAFFGMNYIMGYHKLPSFRDYWSSHPSRQVPFIANVMPRNRFQYILSALHFANNAEMLPRSDPGYDRGYKIRSVFEHLNSSFQLAREPCKQQAIDETHGKIQRKKFNETVHEV